MKKLKVAVSQMTSVDDLEVNIQKILTNLDQLSNSEVDIVFYPENSIYMRLIEGAKIPKIEIQDSCFDRLSQMAVAKNVTLHLGSCPMTEDGHQYNASVIIGADGTRRVSYRKMHLFDITLEGQKPFRESDAFRHGPRPEVIQIQNWKLGQTICYDIRFAELYHHYAKQQVDLILVPAAFLVATGQAHWEVLLRARAIESQAFVVAAAQAGFHQSVSGVGHRSTFGNSLVVDPWGTVIYRGSPDREEFQVVELDHQMIEKVRRQIPMAGHRRL